MDWQITFSTNPAQPFLFLSSNLPIVKLTTQGSAINDNAKVPVLMQIIDHGVGVINYANDTVYAYEGTILTEWQGFTGPMYPKKNYDFDLVDVLGNKIDTTLLGMPAENDWIFKAEYLDHSLIKNTIAYEFARRMGNYAPRIRPCEVILDGDIAEATKAGTADHKEHPGLLNKTGHIGFLGHGDSLRFRNLRIKDIVEPILNVKKKKKS